MLYTYKLPPSLSFTGKGLHGYTFGPLRQKDLDIYYIEVDKGHDTFMISKKITRTYYVLSGNGYFTIDHHRYDVSPGILVEVPPNVEYSYSGKMTLIAFARPRWFAGNDTHTKWNPDVVGNSSLPSAIHQSRRTQLVKMTVFGKSPVAFYLRVNQWAWRRLPASFINLSPVRSYGNFLQKLARAHGNRSQALSTVFLRNRPALDLIRRLVGRKPMGDSLSVVVLGCSTGPEPYSVAWAILSERPDLRLMLHAMDISAKAVEFAKEGLYSLTTAHLTNTRVCENVTPSEMAQIFQQEENAVRVKAWIRDHISWHVGDASAPQTVVSLGPQDIVVANNFLCHMEPPEAEQCLRNIARLVSPGGYLFVSGVDLEVRTKVARDSGWEPVEELLEEIHYGDAWMQNYWPFHYAGLEPLNKKRRDWKVRYAAAFRLGQETPATPAHRQDELCRA